MCFKSPIESKEGDKKREEGSFRKKEEGKRSDEPGREREIVISPRV